MSGPDYHHSSHMMCVVHVGILCDIPVLGMKYKNKRFELSASSKSTLGNANVMDIILFLCLLRRVLFGFIHQHECP